jgi:murein DD-endopeptidase MepM/ murein hydrolase activator NlpD
MHAIVKGSIAAALLTALGSFDRRPRPPEPVVVPPRDARGLDGLPAPCASRTLPEGPICVPIPTVLPQDSGPDSVAATGSHKLPGRGRAEVYDHIPRTPDRPLDYAAYKVPVGDGRAPKILSDYDLHRPGHEQRQGPGFKTTGHGGVDFGAALGDVVRVVALEHQEGDAEVLYVGPMFGLSVVTAHMVREGKRLRAYVVIFGHLDRPDPKASAHARLPAGAALGVAGDTGSPGIVHLHYEVRQVRDGVDLASLSPENRGPLARSLDPKRLLDPAVSIPMDPRNALPLR